MIVSEMDRQDKRALDSQEIFSAKFEDRYARGA
jgi:hypothetical protein